MSGWNLSFQSNHLLHRPDVRDYQQVSSDEGLPCVLMITAMPCLEDSIPQRRGTEAVRELTCEGYFPPQLAPRS